MRRLPSIRARPALGLHLAATSLLAARTAGWHQAEDPAPGPLAPRERSLRVARGGARNACVER